MPNNRLYADAQTYAAFVGFAALHFTTKASPVWALVSRALGKGSAVICFDTKEGRFNLRSAAVIIQDHHVLIHRAASDDFWALPGGRVELFETSVEAVVRELQEELGVECAVSRLLWHTENFFEYRGKRFHELANYHLVSLVHSPAVDSEKDFEGIEKPTDLIFRWVPVAKISDYNIYPRFLEEGLKDLPASIQYVEISEKNA